MKTKNRISYFQLSTLIILFNLGNSILICPEVYFAGQNGWISDLLLIFMGSLSVIILIIIHKSNYKQNIVEIAGDLWSKEFKYILSIVYLIYSLHLGALSLRHISDFLSGVIMPNMSIVVFALVLTLAASYAIIMGIGTIAKLGQIVFPFVMSLFILLLLLSLPNYNYSNLFPVIFDWKDILRGSYSIWSLPIGNLILFSFIIPYVKNNKKQKKDRYFIFSLFISLFISVIIIGLRSIGLILVLGGDLTKIFTYPTFSMVGVIELAQFFERLEAAFLFMWLGSTFITILICYWSAIENIRIMCKTKNYNLFIIPTGVIMVSLSQNLFKNYSEQYVFTLKTWPIYSTIFILIIPILLLMTKLIKGKQENNNQ